MVVVGTVNIPIVSFLVFLTIAMAVFFAVLIYLVLKTNKVERQTQEIQAKLTKQEHILKDEVDALRVLVEPIQYVSNYYSAYTPAHPKQSPPKPTPLPAHHIAPSPPKIPPVPSFSPPKASPPPADVMPLHKKPLTMLETLKKPKPGSKYHLPNLFKKKSE